MPDENKFSKLREVGYRVPGLCGYCRHGNFDGRNRDAAQGWGTCALHRYEHKKHENPDGGRGVSIHVTGTCPSFEADETRIARTGLGAHREFFDGRTGKAPNCS